MAEPAEIVGLTPASFHALVADQARVACILHHGPFVAFEGAVQFVRGASDESWTWARIDLSEAPEIARMFGVSDNEPHLLLMRERIVLYCAPLSAATPEATHGFIEGAAQLDMEQVRTEVEKERAGRESLMARRVCPTVWRTNESDPD